MNTKESYPQRKHIRLREYDYSRPGNYFVTIVTKNREDMFGKVTDGQMILNDAGVMVHNVLEQMSKHNNDMMITDMVIMPNHVHLILCMTSTGLGLSGIIRYFKSKTTVEYIHGVKDKGWRRFDGNLWQFKYYDHIIRSQQAYDKIREYISLNPVRWNKDKLNSICDTDADDVNSMIKMCEYGQIQECVPTINRN